MATGKTYYKLTKPGIVYGNILTTIAGFLFASEGSFNGALFLTTIIGVALVIASACVANNVIDRNIDKRMKRTKKRAIVSGEITIRSAIVFASALGVIGYVFLFFTNNLTVLLGVIAMVFYVAVYGYAKRHTVHSTLVGSIPGALPIVAGYTAVVGSIDLTAFLLFIILATWQMPHFYAISLFRREEYAAANLPILSVKKGIRTTQIQMIIYVIVFIFATLALHVAGPASLIYAIIMSVVGLMWSKKAFDGLRVKDTAKWAKNNFKFSLTTLLVFCFAISIDNFLP